MPHITDAIQDWIERVARIPVDDSGEAPDACIIELGGTVGDIESMPFVEALTQLRRRAGRGNFLNIHVSFVPVVNGELKTKPTQHSVKSVRSAGLHPDLVACRCERSLDRDTVHKIANHCQVDVEQVVVVKDMKTIYLVPLLLETQGLRQLMEKSLELGGLSIAPDMVQQGASLWRLWTKTVEQKDYYEPVDIALVGKYIELHDSYLSTVKSLEHSAMRCRRRLNITWVDAEHLEPKTSTDDPIKYHKAWHDVCSAGGILGR